MSFTWLLRISVPGAGIGILRSQVRNADDSIRLRSTLGFSVRHTTLRYKIEPEVTIAGHYANERLIQDVSIEDWSEFTGDTTGVSQK